MEEILASESKENYSEDIAKAKQMLHEDCKKEEAIERLVEISKTGDKNATEILAECLASGDGITSENRSIVEWCVKTSEVDKRMNHAMTELFMSLKQEGQENVTVQDIKNALKTVKQQVKEASSTNELSEKSKQEELGGLMGILKSAMTIGDKDELTLSEFLDTAMSYAKGEVPEMVMVLDKHEIELYNKASRIEKILKFPLQSLESFKFYALSTISTRGNIWLKSLIPTSQIQTLVLLYFYHQLSAKMLWFLVPLIIFYVSITALIIFSLQMLHGHQSLQKLRNISNLLKKFDPQITSKEAESKFIWNSVTPYFWFFVFIIVTVAVFPLCDKAWVPCSELSLIALFFTVSAFRGLPDEYDDYTMYTIGLKILTLVLRCFSDVRGLWVLYQPFFIIALPYKLDLHISIPGILHLAILVMLVIMAGRHSWKGIYKILIPHIVCLLWWQMFSELFIYTTWSSLIRASIGWVIFITILPLVAVYILGLLLANFLQWFLVIDLASKLAVTALVIGVSSVFVLYSNVNLPEDVKKRRNYVLGFVAVVVLCLLGPLLYVNYVPPEQLADKRRVTWDHYDNTCGPKARLKYTEAALQASCGDLIGESIMWTGRVTSVKVASIDNRFRALVTAMPKALRPTLRCLLGGKEIEEDTLKPAASSGWIFKRKSGIGCSLKSFDRYTFSMGVEFASDSPHGAITSSVTVTHKYYEAMMSLQKNSTVTVKGSITGGMGSALLQISLKKLYIDSVPARKQRTVDKDDMYAGLRQAGRYSVHFFFSPLINEQGKGDIDDDDDDDE